MRVELSVFGRSMLAGKLSNGSSEERLGPRSGVQDWTCLSLSLECKYSAHTLPALLHSHVTSAARKRYIF